MANIPPIQFKRSSDEGKIPTKDDLKVGELAINFADEVLYTKDSDDNIVTVGQRKPADMERPIKVIVRDNGINSNEYYVKNICFRFEDPTETNWWLDSDAANGEFGTTAEVFRYVNGARTAFDSTTKIWLDGSTLSNQAPSPGGMSIQEARGITVSDRNDGVSDFYMNVTGFAQIAGYTPKCIYANDDDNLGLFGFTDGNDYLVRFWGRCPQNFSNNYHRFFGFTSKPITETGDCRDSNPGFFIGNNSTSRGIVISKNGSTSTNSTAFPAGLDWNDVVQITFSCQRIATTTWFVRFYINGEFIDSHVTNISACHFRFGTGWTRDDGDSAWNATHVQVDEYTAGDLGAPYTVSSDYTETNKIFNLNPTEAYAADYSYVDYELYKKTGVVGGNTSSDWLLT